MDRRGFLKFFSGGLVATATMAEAGAFAEFLDWIKRAPAFSFASPKPLPLFDLISAATLESIRTEVLFDNFFKPSPFIEKLRYNGGTHIIEPFSFDDDIFKVTPCLQV